LNVIEPLTSWFTVPDRVAWSLSVLPTEPDAVSCVVGIEGWFGATITGSSLQPLATGLLSESPP